MRLIAQLILVSILLAKAASSFLSDLGSVQFDDEELANLQACQKFISAKQAER